LEPLQAADALKWLGALADRTHTDLERSRPPPNVPGPFLFPPAASLSFCRSAVGGARLRRARAGRAVLIATAFAQEDLQWWVIGARHWTVQHPELEASGRAESSVRPPAI